ncbi:MAG: malate synthase [Alteromonadaceae bacterium]|jgi:malate synthase
MNERVTQHGYDINGELYNFVNQDVLPGTGIEATAFWKTLTDIFSEFTPRNRELLAKREQIQQQIDAWHSDTANQPMDANKYQQFLTDIGYIVPEKPDFSITTQNVDSEVATVAGPQLVVPLMNARYALNAANARWGSLYDALYGTDVISQDDGAEITQAFNPARGAKVIAYARDFLNKSIPLNDCNHNDATNYRVKDGQLLVTLANGDETGLADADQFVGYQGEADAPTAILCVNNGLHIVIQIDDQHSIGKTDAAGVKDVMMEAALSTIQDCEDSIAAVDGSDKTAVYRNWLGLMKGDLTESLEKNGKTITRKLNADPVYTGAKGDTVTLPGRSLQFIRNVGHLMTNNAVLNSKKEEMPEGILDGIITSLISIHDLQGNGVHKNSRVGSIYIVKPKMHGPEEVLFTCDLFGAVEAGLGLPVNTIKVGIMDEERRTSVNLKECIRVAQERVVFINTGFLDRTGDEIHTSMLAGPMVRKDAMKDEKWIASYEARNVNIGLRAGLKGKAQIGKGMWPVPDQMANMMTVKIGHPNSGANCAWVPSPTAATLHAMHYHAVKVSDVQEQMLKAQDTTSLTDLITIPLLADPSSLSADDIKAELDNNIQGLLGYVVRWVDQGIGCSKVPDILDVGRMEDRATLRISSQHICNWLHHKILTEAQIMASLKRMAAIVDGQNAGDSNYLNMAPNFDDSIAFAAAADLIFKGEVQPSGYTEPLLHQSRIAVKAK